MNNGYRIGEFAKLAGVTVRALHHYDRIGLLKPQRSASGTRLYRLQDLERLVEIAALKFLGIPLREIKLLLKHGPLTLADSLQVQREALTEKRGLIDRALVAIEVAEQSIHAGQTTDASILRKIIEVIDMQPQEDFMRKYYTEQAWIERAQLRDQWAKEPAEAREQFQQAWPQLVAEIEAALDLDPASEAAQALTKQWLRLAGLATAGNEGIRTGSMEAFKDRQNWPQDEQDKLLTGLGFDPGDRTSSVQRLEAVVKFIRLAIGYKVQTNLRSLYGLDQPS